MSVSLSFGLVDKAPFPWQNDTMKCQNILRVGHQVTSSAFLVSCHFHQIALPSRGSTSNHKVCKYELWNPGLGKSPSLSPSRRKDTIDDADFRFDVVIKVKTYIEVWKPPVVYHGFLKNPGVALFAPLSFRESDDSIHG